MDSTLYVDPGQDICDTLYPLAGVRRQGRVPCSTPLWSLAMKSRSESLVRTSTWISRKPILAAQHGLEAAMRCRTAARLRNRHQLDSWPVSVPLAQTKRVAGLASPGTAGSAAGTLTPLAMIATAISKRVETDHMSQSWNNTVCTRCWPDPELYTYNRAGMRQKKN